MKMLNVQIDFNNHDDLVASLEKLIEAIGNGSQRKTYGAMRYEFTSTNDWNDRAERHALLEILSDIDPDAITFQEVVDYLIDDWDTNHPSDAPFTVHEDWERDAGQDIVNALMAERDKYLSINRI